MREFDLINHYFRHRTQGDGVLLGPGDDAALLTPSPNHSLVMTLDTLIEGRHFPTHFPAQAIGHRSLATNLSDLAAMGASPRWCLLSLCLPQIDSAWLEGFCDGFYALADATHTSLVGGDTVKGNLAISIQATGQVPTGQALRRNGARPGDQIVIGGLPGEAALGLLQWQEGIKDTHAVTRFCYPQPQLALGQRLLGHASSCIDVSDGLLADLQHLLRESGDLGAQLTLDNLPPLTSPTSHTAAQLRQLQLTGGDDYLLLFTLPAENEVPAGCFTLGQVTPQGSGLLVEDASQPLAISQLGWQHF